jgi:hypothetical protein
MKALFDLRCARIINKREHSRGLTGLVVMARDQAPDPIPNSAVKALSADGTTS